MIDRDPLLLTPSQTAQALSISQRKLWEMTMVTREIPHVRLGRCVRYSVADLNNAIDSLREDGTSACSP
jgi:hypothetical protein